MYDHRRQDSCASDGSTGSDGSAGSSADDGPQRTTPNVGHADLSATARTILESLCNTRDHTLLDRYVSAQVTVQHDDVDDDVGGSTSVTSRDGLLQHWTRTLQLTPDLHVDVKEACVDERQLKVWVRSEITGYPRGVRKESVDMMTFDRAGVLVNSVDCRRVLGRRRGRREEDD